MLTAVTDEQIREALARLWLHPNLAAQAADPSCWVSSKVRHNARARCAEIINAREASKAVR